MGTKFPPLKAESFMPFGKYKGKLMSAIAEINPEYLVWLSREVGVDVDNEFMMVVEAAIAAKKEER